MKILDDGIDAYGNRITIYEAADTSRSHCGQYCTMSGAHCKFCRKDFGYSKDECHISNLLNNSNVSSEDNLKGLEKWM